MRRLEIKKVKNIFRRNGNSCHGSGSKVSEEGLVKIGIVGNPNVGKSVIFNKLTGARVVVSNYPGTTVDVSRGKAKIQGTSYEIVDTPGMYSLMPITEEERVARLLLFEENPEAIIHVVDAKNLERMLPLTLQLIETGFPILLDLNMSDEAENAGMHIDMEKLENELGIPVVATVATTGQGMDTLRTKISEYVTDRNR